MDVAALDIRVKSSGIKQATRDLDSLEKNARKTETATQRMERSFQSLKKNVLSLQTAFAGLAVGMAAFRAIKIGANFEQQMAKVRGITQATQSEFIALTNIAKKLGATTGWSATQAAQGLEFLAMAGFSAEKAIKALPGVLDLATAGAIDLGRAADIVSNALTAMRLPVESLSRVNDVFVKTITSSNTNMEMMAESFKYSAPLAAAYGMEIETLAGLIGMLGNAGIQGSMAGTQLAFAFQNVQKVFDKYGESATRADGSSRDLIGALELLQERGASTSEVMEIFGVRAGRAALALLGQGVPALKAYLKELENVEGTTSKLAKIMRDTLTGDIKTLKSTLEDLALSGFEKYGTSLRSFVQETTEYFRNNKEEIIELTVSIGKVAEDLGKITLLIGKLGGETLKVWNELPQPVREVGLIAAIVGGKPAIKAIALVALLNSQLGKLKMGLGDLGKAFDDFGKYAQNIEDVLTGKKDWNTGAIKNVEDLITAFVELHTAQGSIWVERGDMDAYLSDLNEIDDKTKELGNESATAFGKIQLAITEANKELDEFWKTLQKHKSIMDPISLAAFPEFERGIESIIRKYNSWNKAIEKNAEKAGYSTEEIALLYANLGLRMEEEVDDYIKSYTEGTKDIKDLLSDIGGLDFKGTSFGNEMADGINNAMISMQSLNDLFTKHAKIQEGINKLIAEGREEEAKRVQAALNAKGDDYFQAQISGYRQLFGTVSQLFKENSKEREALHKVEMAFAVVELAMSAKKMAMDAASTVMAIANSAKRCVAWGIEAVAAAVAGIAGQATGDPYTAFARIAAMIALMGSVLAMAGKAFGGGGSSGGHSDTAISTIGTILGDPTKSSESLQNSLEMMKEYHAEDYRELVGIHNEMKDLNDNITGLVAIIIRGFGGFSGDQFEYSSKGLFGKQSDEMIKAFERITDAFTLPLDFAGKLINAITSFITDIAGKIGDFLFGGKTKVKVTGAGIAVGYDEKGRPQPTTVGDVLADDYPSVQAYYDIYKKTSGGLFGSTKRKRWTEYEDVDADIERLFNKIYENIANMLVYLAEGFNLSAEDMAAVLAYEFEAMKIDLKGLTGEEISEKINAWISTMGDEAIEALFGDIVGKYQEVGEGMLETAMRLLVQKEILFSVLEMTNMAFDDTSTSAIDFSQALIAMAGDFEGLIESIGNYYDKFFTDEEKQQDLLEGLALALGDVNLTLPFTREGFRDLVESLDLTTEEGKRAFVALMDAADAADALYSYLEDTTMSGLELAKALELLSAKMLEAGKTAEDVAAMMSAAIQGIIQSIEDIYRGADDTKTAVDIARERYGSADQWTESYENWKTFYEGMLAAAEAAGMSLEEYLRSLGIDAAEALQDFRNVGAELAAQAAAMRSLAEGMADVYRGSDRTSVDIARERYGSADEWTGSYEAWKAAYEKMLADAEAVGLSLEAYVATFAQDAKQAMEDFLAVGQYLQQQEAQQAADAQRQWDDQQRQWEEQQREQQRLHDEWVRAQEQIIDGLERAAEAIADTIANLTLGSLAPTQSVEAMQARYAELYAATLTASPEDMADAARAFSDFASGEYLRFMQAYAPADYDAIFAATLQDLRAIQGLVESTAFDIGNSIGSLGNTLQQSIWDLGDILGMSIDELREMLAQYLQSFFSGGHQSGGLTHGLSLAGEIGPEWVVPTYEPQRSSFLQSVGADPDAIGKSVAKYITRTGTGTGPKEIHIRLSIDGQEIRNPVIVGLQGRDSQLIEAVRKAA